MSLCQIIQEGSVQLHSSLKIQNLSQPGSERDMKKGHQLRVMALALKIKQGDHDPREEGSLQNLEKARQQIVP